MTLPMQTQDLVHGWSFSEVGSDEWMPVAKVPTNVHLDLLDNKKIEDPFLGFNELKCEWVNEQAWLYKIAIQPIPDVSSGTKHVLAFDVLDTFATVRLNGNVILRSDNMWIMHRVDVTNLLSSNVESQLEIEFKSAMVEARKIKDAHPEHKWVGFNGDMARLAVRKAQYHWGWDWGPILSPCGPWRAVRLETYHSRVSDLRIEYKVNSNYDSVSGTITVTTEGASAKAVRLQASLDGRLVFQGNADVNYDGLASLDFHISKPKLWYPHGYGEQPLYDVSATVTNGKHVLHTLTKRTGFRNGELVQEPDELGKTFYFRINGVDIFCGGSDWIPADSFTPRISEDRYRKWLKTMVDGYQVMIRVWGGGIWEEDVFYELCDELGVLVWQDFMFGCGNYPCFPSILESIEQEAICQMKRLRHHPSIAVFAGNNEDYQVQESFGLTYDYEDKDPSNWLKTNFPARFIYEKLLPDVVSAHAHHIAYHPGSPWGDGKISSDPTVGDMHQWNVWHGTQEKYQIFDTLGGRFNSEFGMEAFPHIDTIKWFVTDPSQLYPQSQMIDFHNKADGHERRIATYLVENFRTETSLEKHIHLTQLSQAETMTFGYRGWLRRTLAPIAVAVKRAHHDWSVVHARPAKILEYECWVASSLTEEVIATVEVRFISIQTGQKIKAAIIKNNIRVVANGTTEVLGGVVDNDTEEPHVIAARIWVNGEIRHRDVDWPQPLKYLDFADRQVQIVHQGNQIRLKTGKPTKGVVFEEREGISISDSAIDLVPGDEQVVSITGLGQDDPPLSWTFLGAP